MMETEVSIRETEKLPVNEATFRALIDAVQDYAIFRLDPVGRVVTWNRGAERINGYSAQEILGRNFSCFYLPEDQAAGAPAHHLELAARQGRVAYQGLRLRKDGTPFWANVVITSLRDENGELKGFAKVTQDISALRQAEEALRRSEYVLDTFFRASPVGLAILDRNLRYQRVNETLAVMDGLPARKHIGKTVREVVGDLADQMESHLQWVLANGRPLLDRELSGCVPHQKSDTRYWLASFFPISDESGDSTQVGAVFLDTTDRHRADESLRRLSGRLMDLQDQERRRIARELHDSVGQCLTAIKLNLELLERELQPNLAERAQKAIAECKELASQCSTDTRTISYLLHPPLLDERGLASAVRWYADGFAQRSGIDVSLNLPAEGTRLPQSLETTLFRILQEALTNIHRHSGSPRAMIRLAITSQQVTLEVRDEGKGMNDSSLRHCNGNDRPLGVGIAGMRERVRQLGGRLNIESSFDGTTIEATLPLGGQP